VRRIRRAIGNDSQKKKYDNKLKKITIVKPSDKKEVKRLLGGKK